MSTYIKEERIAWQGETHKSTTTAGDGIMLLTATDPSSRQKMSNHAVELDSTNRWN